MGKLKRSAAFILLLFLISIFMVAIHHHDDINDQDCPICFVSHHQNATHPSTDSIQSAPFFTKILYATLTAVITKNILISSLNNHSPPA